MNTGLQDAHNIAWKIAMVVKGKAPNSLLATYESGMTQDLLYQVLLVPVHIVHTLCVHSAYIDITIAD